MKTLKQFTLQQQKTVGEKIEQLKAIRDGTLKPNELADAITKRRLEWLRINRNLLQHDLPLPEAAYRLIVYDHMQVDDGISMKMVTENLLRVECRNFCPYLEACSTLEMDTRYVCKEIGEPSLIEFFKEINPSLHFSRDYYKIRPHHDCCVEFVESK